MINCEELLAWLEKKAHDASTYPERQAYLNTIERIKKSGKC